MAINQGGYITAAANDNSWRTITLPMSFTRSNFSATMGFGQKNPAKGTYTEGTNTIKYYFYQSDSATYLEPLYYIAVGI